MLLPFRKLAEPHNIERCMSFPHLFSPLQVGHTTLKNRIAHLATLTQYGQNNQVTQTLIDYHRARAIGGVAMSIVEGLAIHPSSVPLRTVVTVFDQANKDSLQQLASAGEEYDCRMIGQLWHVGRQQLWSPIDAPVGVSEEPDAFSWTVPQKADRGLIEELVEAFVEAAKRLQDCGFSGVELHAAHGYLLTQFMSPWSNTRDDDYGGDLPRRLRVIRDIINGIRQRCGNNFIVGLKMPAQEGVNGGIDLAEAQRITKHLVAQEKPDYFAYSQGNFSLSLEDHNPNMHYKPGHFLALHRALRPYAAGVPIMAVGRIGDAEHSEHIIADGVADLIGLGRALVADPNWPEKARSGRSDYIRPCIFCNLCWDEIHAGKPLLCIHNPKLPSADEAQWQPTVKTGSERKRIIIVGAGPAGLEAAWVAAAQGHQVTSFGVSADVGGALRLDAKLPGRGDVSKVYQYQYQQAQHYGVEFILGQTAEHSDIIECQPDTVLIATGGSPRAPSLTTDHAIFSWREKVVELTADSSARAGTAVLFDMDHTDPTYAFADLLALRYEKAVIITPRIQLARAAPYTNAIGIYRRLLQANAEIITTAQLVNYADGVVTYANVFSGKEAHINDVALLAYSTPRQANNQLFSELTDQTIDGLDVRLIGDARSPRNLFSAIHEGFYQANRL